MTRVWLIVCLGLVGLGLYTTGSSVADWLSGGNEGVGGSQDPLAPLAFVVLTALVLVMLVIWMIRLLSRRGEQRIPGRVR